MENAIQQPGSSDKHGVHFNASPSGNLQPLVPHNQLISRLNSLLPPIQVFNQITSWISGSFTKCFCQRFGDHLPQTYEYDITTLHRIARTWGYCDQTTPGRQFGVVAPGSLPGGRLLVRQPCPCRLRCPIQRQSSMFSYPCGSHTMVVQEFVDLAVVDGCGLISEPWCRNRYAAECTTARIAQADQYITTTTKSGGRGQLLAPFPLKQLWRSRNNQHQSRLPA